MRNGFVRLFFFALLIFPFFFSQPSAAIDWLPIDPADLAMKDNPANPGSQAMILYRDVERNDAIGYETEYVRIKIFKEEGKGYADVVIPWGKGHYSAIDGVRGRTIHPDGTIVPFNGEVFEKVQEYAAEGFGQVHRDSKSRIQVKTLALPDVTPGSIVEYQYTLHWPGGISFVYRPFSSWVVQRNLYQRKAHFSMKVFRTQLYKDLLKLAVRAVALPPDARIVPSADESTYTLDVQNIPAFEREPNMPPREDLRGQVLFFYSEEDMYNPDKFWKAAAKRWQTRVEDFMNKRGALERQLAEIVAANDSPDVKAHKIYDYVQTLDSLDYGTTRAHKGLSEENNNVEDVIRHKYGYMSELNRLYVALARSAGLEATIVAAADRSQVLFHKDWPSVYQLSLEVALVRLNGKDLYLSPGSFSCPFGSIPWEATGSTGIKMDKNPPAFVQLPLPDPTTTQYKTVAKMKLEDTGTLAGDIDITFTGQAAFDRRIAALEQDEEARKKESVEMLKGWLGVPAEVELTKVSSWDSSTPLVLSYKVSIPHFGSVVGRRVLLRTTLLPGGYRNSFTSARRVHPVVMEFPYQRIEDVTIALPPGVQPDSLPAPKEEKNAVGELATRYTSEANTLHLIRDFKLVSAGMKIELEYYPALRSYFQSLQAGTNETVVLKNGGSNAAAN